MNVFPLVLAFLAIVGAGCNGGSDSRAGQAGIVEIPGGGAYVALGDSIAAGEGASDPATRGYTALLAERLREKSGSEPELVSLAEGGATTEDLIDEQLPAALEQLSGGDVALVTVTIGGNNLNVIQDSPAAPICIEDVSDPACPVDDILVQVEGQLDEILRALRSADEDAAMVIQIYPNLFSGTGHLLEPGAEAAFGLLNEVIIDAAGRHGFLTADPRAAFQGRAGELTDINQPMPTFHPNDAGYAEIAGAFYETLELEGD
jgi:lysophospholipase L1-like esterase